MNIKKRGMSSIVATSLIITITILAGAIIGTFVVPFVQKNLERSTECTSYDTYFTLENELLGPICYQGTKNYIVVGAKNDKSLEPNVNGFQVRFVQIAKIGGGSGAAQSVGMKQSYVYDDGIVYDRVDVSAIVGNSRICERSSDTAKILPCGNARS